MAADRTVPTGEEFERQYRAAVQKGRQADEVEPRAAAARYDRERGAVVLELAGGVSLSFDPARLRWLDGLTPDQLACVRVSLGGAGLRWDEPDVDLSVPGVVALLLDLDRWAPRYLGQTRSEAKARAARENGRKGGRPRRAAVREEPAAYEAEEGDPPPP